MWACAKTSFFASLCPNFVACSCAKDVDPINYTQGMCQDAFKEASGSLEEYHGLITKKICKDWLDACEEVDGRNCTKQRCLESFPRFKTDYLRPYDNGKHGCMLRLRSNGAKGLPVLQTLAEYNSLAKCCYEEADGKKQFKWLGGSELVKTKRPWKWAKGRVDCDTKKGWTSAHKVYAWDEVSTRQDCESK